MADRYNIGKGGTAPAIPAPSTAAWILGIDEEGGTLVAKANEDSSLEIVSASVWPLAYWN